MEPKIAIVENTVEKPMTQHVREEIQIKDNSTILTPLVRDKKKGVSKFWNKVSEWF
jgi:cell division protein FtsA